MPLLSASGLGKVYGARTLFAGADFTLDEGCRVGLIGANGVGKTTLFRILLGADDDHEGDFNRRRDLRVAALDQEPRFPEGVTVREAMLSGDAELLELERGMHAIHHALEGGGGDTAALLDRLGDLESRFEARRGWEIESRAERILEGVGFPRDLVDAPVEGLSGGERGRLAFARILLLEPELWLLDEPTNHLDIDGILFLEDFLRSSKASAVIISHDRRFLDRVTEETWEIESERLWDYPAPYSRARELRDERLKSARRAFDLQQAFIDKEQAFIRRYQAGQRARQATGRLKRLDRLERLARPEDRARVMDLRLSAGESPGAKILALREVAARFGGRTLFDGLELDLARGEVLAVAGPNGAGKTTLLRILAGDLPPSSGTVRWGEKVRLGVLSQHERFPEEAVTPYAFLRAAAPRLTEQELRNLLAAMLFPGDAIDRPVSGLSGGERKRLMLTKLLVEGCNVLLLDEPTNHLDLPSREALEVALAAYEGTLIVVSHDRHFVDQMADRMLWIEDGAFHLSEGGFAEALARREKRKAEAARNGPRTVSRAPVAPSAPPPPKPKSPYSKLGADELERRIAEAGGKLRALEASFADPGVFKKAAKLKAAKEEAERLKAEIAGMEEEWLTRG
jgi:ATP-binding cassette subfamily F protein 3